MSAIRNQALKSKVMSAEDAAALIPNGANVGMSGFTGSGYPKAVPTALASRIDGLKKAGNEFSIGLLTGASTGPELDGELAKVDAISFRTPFNSDPVAREKINTGKMKYLDMHLSQLAPAVWQGVMGKLDTAII